MAQTLTPEVLTAAIDGLTAKQEAIGRQIAELRAVLSSASPDGNASDTNPAPSRSKRGGKRVLGPEARERIAAAQRARWAAARGEKPQTSAPAKAARKKRRLSPEGRKAIQEALRKRWAAKRAEAAQPSAKKSAPKRGRPRRAHKRKRPQQVR